MKKAKTVKMVVASEQESTVASIPFDESDKKTQKINRMLSSGSSRRNISSTTERSDKYANIEEGLSPFSESGSTISVKEAVSLCQKAYYNFPIFRNTIELMVEFSVNNIYFRGGNAKSRKFFESWFKKINGKDFADKFFREYYRSGNAFIHKHNVKMSESDISEINKTYGTSIASKTLIPVKYVILNPTDIEYAGSVSFSFGNYVKTLNDYELSLLKNPRTKEDKEYFNSLDKETQEQIKSGSNSVSIPLKPDEIYAIFYKKQDYEPFSVPMGYGVLSDISFKEELKKMDIALARVIQQVILLVTTGNEPDKGGINHKNIEAFRAIFENQSIGRVLVADYTTKAEFVIPQIADILDPKKYEIVNQDIQTGLHNILTSSEKFANESLKIQLFVEKLKQARQTFIDLFLMPEIKIMSDNLGFKNYPTPYFEEYDLKDEVEFARIYSRLAELGILTPEETIRAIETGVLPDQESSEESQRKFKGFRDEELYMPMAALAKEEKIDQSAGRPKGTGTPQSTKKVSPIGASYKASKLTEVVVKASKLDSELEKQAKKHFNVKKINEEQKQSLMDLAFAIMSNEKIEDWEEKVLEYIEKPKTVNKNLSNKVNQIVEAHGIGRYEALLLSLSE